MSWARLFRPIMLDSLLSYGIMFALVPSRRTPANSPKLALTGLP